MTSQKKGDIKVVIVVLLGLTLLIYLLISTTLHVLDNEYEAHEMEVLQNADSVYCKITDIGYRGRGRYCEYAYDVGSKEYHSSTGCNIDVQIGECYKIIYKKNDPNEHYILFDYPLLPDQVQSDSVCCEVIQVDEYHVRVQYIVNSILYKRFQRVKESNVSYKLGEHWLFKYNIKNPSSGYIQRTVCN